MMDQFLASRSTSFVGLNSSEDRLKYTQMSNNSSEGDPHFHDVRVSYTREIPYDDSTLFVIRLDAAHPNMEKHEGEKDISGPLRCLLKEVAERASDILPHTTDQLGRYLRTVEHDKKSASDMLCSEDINDVCEEHGDLVDFLKTFGFNSDGLEAAKATWMNERAILDTMRNGLAQYNLGLDNATIDALVLNYTELRSFVISWKANDLQDISNKLKVLSDDNVRLRRGLRTLGSHNPVESTEAFDAREDRNKFLAVTGYKSLGSALQAWQRDQADLTSLKNQSLGAADRHSLTFDAEIREGFKSLHAKVKMFLRLNPLMTGLDWHNFLKVGVCSHDSISPALADYIDGNATAAKSIIKHLAVNAIWTFLAAKLFDRKRPFDAFLGSHESVARQLNSLYTDIFPDYETNEESSKWRAAAVRQLASVKVAEPSSPDAKPDILEDSLRKGLLNLWETILGANEHKDLPENSDKDVVNVEVKGKTEKAESKTPNVDEKLKKKPRDFFERLDKLIHEAVIFSRLLAGERAGYTITLPSVVNRDFEPPTLLHKRFDDETLTTMPEKDAEISGTVLIAIAPKLIKWGTGLGINLKNLTIIAKSLVLVSGSK